MRREVLADGLLQLAGGSGGAAYLGANAQVMDLRWSQRAFLLHL